MGAIELFSLGGVVMWPLLMFSILVTALILERALFWLQLSKQQQPIVQQVLSTFPEDPILTINRLQQHKNLPIARIFLAALTLPHPTPEEFRLALESAAQAEMPILKRFGTVFETVIGIAPLLGLLGTILGLIEALGSVQIGALGAQDTAGVTAGIGEALISTAAGLIIAIFTLLFANLFQGLYRRQRALIEEYGGRLEILYRRYYRYRQPR